MPTNAFTTGSLLDPRARTFDVVCAGEALVSVADEAAFLGKGERLRLRPGGGAMKAALALAAQGLRVGLATVLADDTVGRALLAKVAATGVDVGGVEMAQRSSGIVLVRGGARQVIGVREEDQPISIPATWSSQVLLLSGMSPVVAHGAALCKAARAARRAGTIVVVDVNARWDLWQGRDARMIRMVLREADVVWCNAQDLVGLNVDVKALRAALRPDAVLVRSDGLANVSATGPFGEVAHTLEPSTTRTPLGDGDAFTAAICAELARTGHTDERSGALWSRALGRAHAVVKEESRR
jgi:sugar/nucleoside kinase (ribokinase family)